MKQVKRERAGVPSKAVSHHKSKNREFATPHTMWVRDDIWAALKYRRYKTKHTMKSMTEEALYDFLMRKDVEERTGVDTPLKDTVFHPELGTRRLDEFTTEELEELQERAKNAVRERQAKSEGK